MLNSFCVTLHISAGPSLCIEIIGLIFCAPILLLRLCLCDADTRCLTRTIIFARIAATILKSPNNVATSCPTAMRIHTRQIPDATCLAIDSLIYHVNGDDRIGYFRVRALGKHAGHS